MRLGPLKEMIGKYPSYRIRKKTVFFDFSAIGVCLRKCSDESPDFRQVLSDGFGMSKTVARFELELRDSVKSLENSIPHTVAVQFRANGTLWYSKFLIRNTTAVYDDTTAYHFLNISALHLICESDGTIYTAEFGDPSADHKEYKGIGEEIPETILNRPSTGSG